MDMDTTYTITLVALMAIAAASHTGICVGIPVGSGLIGRREAVLLYIVAALTGAILQGKLMAKAVLAPSLCAVLTTTAISTLPAVLGIPLSINFALYTSQIGCNSLVGIDALLHSVMTWIAITVMIAFVTYSLEKSILSSLVSRCRSPRRVLSWFRMFMVLLGMFMSFVVGANTFGYLFMFTTSAVQQLLLCIAFICSAAIFSSRSVMRVAFSFYRIRFTQALSSLIVVIAFIEIATWFGIPFSASLAVASALYAAGHASTFHIISTKSFLYFVTAQFLSIPTALFLGSILSLAITS